MVTNVNTNEHTHTHSLSLSLYIYIYIYICECVLTVVNVGELAGLKAKEIRTYCVLSRKQTKSDNDGKIDV